MKMFWLMMILMGMLVVGAIVAAVDPDVLDEPTVTPTATVESENALPKAYLGEDGYYYIDVIMVDYDGVEHTRKVVVIPYEEDDGSVRYFMPTPTPTPKLS